METNIQGAKPKKKRKVVHFIRLYENVHIVINIFSDLMRINHVTTEKEIIASQNPNILDPTIYPLKAVFTMQSK